MTKGMKYDQDFKDRAGGLVSECLNENEGSLKTEAYDHVASLVGVTREMVSIWYRNQGKGFCSCYGGRVLRLSGLSIECVSWRKLMRF